MNNIVRKLFFIFSVLLLTVHCSPLTVHAEKIYIDITSPGIRRLPIAIQPFSGAPEISSIIKADLTFTGLFECLPEDAQIERPAQPFNPSNWRGLGVELVIKGQAATGPAIKIIVSAHDVSGGAEMLRKEYSASQSMLRPLAHTIANDIYKILTGQQGIFRTKIAFVSETKDSKELHIMDYDGFREYSTGIKGGIILAPRWSPDGLKLIYSAERNRSWDIYLLDMNTMKERNIVMLKGLNMAGNFHPNNREFVFASSKDGRADIFSGDIVNSQGRKLISSPWIDVSPAVSPNGNSILFVSNRSGSPQIYMSDKDGEGINRLTFEGSYNTSPAWSPKGDRIVLTRMIGSKNHIFTMKPDGSSSTQLTDKGNNENPSFSPDGRYIVFSSDRDGVKGIYIMRANGEGQMRITPKGIKATRPGWSPF